MKLIKTLVYTLIVCVSLVSHAEAKGRTASFKGGFSSQVRSVSKPSPVSYSAPVNYTASGNSTNKAATFGAFGGAKVNAAQNGNPSQMSRDLNTNAAQANALKTADARNNINSNNSANPPTGGNGGGGGGGNGWFRSGNNNAAPQQPNYSQPLYSQLGHQTIVQQNNGGFMHGLMWFMIGRSTVSQNNTVYVPVNNQAASGQIVNPNNGSSWDANGTAQQQMQVAPMQEKQSEEKESFFTKIFRWMLWIGFIWGIIWVVRKVIGFRSRNLSRATNYSLRS